MSDNETLWKFKPSTVFGIAGAILAGGMFIGGLGNDLLDRYGCDEIQNKISTYCKRCDEEIVAIERLIKEKGNKIKKAEGLELEIIENEIEVLKFKLNNYQDLNISDLCD